MSHNLAKLEVFAINADQLSIHINNVHSNSINWHFASIAEIKGI